MADSSINSFMSAFDGGSRPNMYSISLVCPIGPIPQLQFYCKAATLPQSFLGEIMVPYMGRVAKYPGDRQFDDWTIDVLNDQNMTLRNTFELWNELFNSNSGNSTPYPNPSKPPLPLIPFESDLSHDTCGLVKKVSLYLFCE